MLNSEISLYEGMIYLMVIMSAADKDMNDAELARMGRLVQYLPVFEDYDENELIGAATRCSNILAGDRGLEDVLQIIQISIPDRLYDTAYAIAVEMASADLSVKAEEIRMLQLVRDRLDLDKLTCAAIERSAIARYRKVRSIDK